MLYAKVSPAEKRTALRNMLTPGAARQFPGAFNPLSARLIEDKNFDCVYIYGSVLADDLGLTNIGMSTLPEVAHRAGQTALMTDLPALVDADTGFGEPMIRDCTIQELEPARLAGMNIEDQNLPQRWGHFDGK